MNRLLRCLPVSALLVVGCGVETSVPQAAAPGPADAVERGWLDVVTERIERAEYQPHLVGEEVQLHNRAWGLQGRLGADGLALGRSSDSELRSGVGTVAFGRTTVVPLGAWSV